MSYNPAFLSTDSFGDRTFLTNLENNMKLFLDWGFLNIGAYQNVSIPSTNIHNFNLHLLRPKKDATQLSYKVWISPKKDWVHESGVCFKNESPLAFSGLYINNVFYPGPTGNNTIGYKVDYPNGQILFNSAVPPTSIVAADYSYKIVQVYKSNSFPQWKEIQLDSSLNSFNQFQKYDTGDFALDAEHRVQLPSIIIDIDSRSTAKPFRLGDRSLIISQDILLHVLSDNKNDRNTILDIVRLQKDRYVWLFDTNKVIADKKYELNFDGSINTNGNNYHSLVNNPTYRWKLSRITDVSFSDITFYHMNLFGSTIRLTQEIIYEDFSSTCFVEDESSGFSGVESISLSSSSSSSSSGSSESSGPSVSEGSSAPSSSESSGPSVSESSGPSVSEGSSTPSSSESSSAPSSSGSSSALSSSESSSAPSSSESSSGSSSAPSSSESSSALSSSESSSAPSSSESSSGSSSAPSSSGSSSGSSSAPSSSGSSSGSSSASSGTTSNSTSESSSASSSTSDKCNVVGCPDADENANIIDCGLVDPNCYFDCNICDCICSSSSESYISEGTSGSSGATSGSSGTTSGSSGPTSGSSSSTSEACTDCYAWAAGLDGSKIGVYIANSMGLVCGTKLMTLQSNGGTCVSGSVTICGATAVADRCCIPECDDYTDCSCWPDNSTLSCATGSKVRSGCGCNYGGTVIFLPSEAEEGCECCGCEVGTCIAWGPNLPGGYSCGCPSSDATCCGDADNFCIHTVPGDPNQSCIDGLEGIPGGNTGDCCDCGATIVDQTTYDNTGEVVCKETYLACGPILASPPPIECEGGSGNCLFVTQYHCALKQEWICDFIPDNQGDDQDSCACYIASENYVPCSECTNTPPPMSQPGDDQTPEGCRNFTYCQYYDCNGVCGEGDGCGPAKTVNF